jgi:hypothetical protein
MGYFTYSFVTILKTVLFAFYFAHLLIQASTEAFSGVRANSQEQMAQAI